MRPLSIRLRIPFFASSSVIGGGVSCASTLFCFGRTASGSTVDPVTTFFTPVCH
jgi:hypothetical protein